MLEAAIDSLDVAEEEFQRRAAWLEGNGYSEGDVMEDENGEYVISTNENGTAEEDGYAITPEKVYLKDAIQ